MKKNKKLKRLFILRLAVMISLTTAISPIAYATEEKDESNERTEEVKSYGSEYGQYLEEHQDKPFVKNGITMDMNEKEVSHNVTMAEATFEVQEEGMYQICMTYTDLLNDDLSIEVGFYFDEEVPYSELGNVTFSKVYEKKSDKVEKDEFGNEIRPEVVEKQRPITEWARNKTGMYSEPYAIFLTAGKHTLTIKNVLGAISVSSIELKMFEEPVPYDAYISAYAEENRAGESEYQIEAEDIYEVSESTLSATSDSTNAGMSPASSTKTLINSFGQDSWNSDGQWGSWKVPENVKAGLYKLSFRVKQTGAVGIYTYRKLYINGEVPFAEANALKFSYDTKWQIQTFGEENPYYVYLKPGDILTLEATTGEMTEAVNKIYTTMNLLNDIYQSIIIVTGTEPDDNRDYNIHREIPTLLEDMKLASREIDEIGHMISDIMGDTNSKVYFMHRFVNLLNGFVENYRTIVSELDTFKSYIDSFSAQTYDFNNLPLEIDWISLAREDAKEREANAGWWKSFVFEIQRFFHSFSKEVSKKNDKGETITVWCSLGRDQMQAVKNLIESDFVPKTGINVDLKMTTTTLSEAILAGREPDVSLSVEQTVPIDLALRNQIVDLTPYLENASKEYLEQFNESAWTPFEYDGGVYAIPLTQDFHMMFYRKDILDNLGIELPDTWEELYSVMRQLQKSNFQVGIKESDSSSAGLSSAIPIFDMFLYQNGGTYFNEELTQSAFESNEGKAAFKQWVSLYSEYGLTTSFDELSRFRSGEMPIIISSQALYKNISVTAPEIAGRWGMTCVPGTQQEDGTIDRSESSTVTGTIILKGAQARGVADEAFEFVSWWTDAETQYEYSTAMESIQGVAGRVSTANTKTFERLSWTKEEKEVLKAQREYVIAINQIPGMYIINRSLTSALRNSYESTAVDPFMQLNIQNSIVNEEIVRKRKEFVQNND